MILLDTSVLVRYLKTASPGIREILTSADCSICGVTTAEILHGARNPDDANHLRQAINVFPCLPIDPQTWDQLGVHLAILGSRGLPMPFQDVLIATVAIQYDAYLWSYDAHFQTIHSVLPLLKLFNGPTT